MRAIVVRHYKTVNNVSNEIMGWGDAPRAKNWRVDLAYVDEILSNNNLNFSALFTSNLERSRQTGRYFANSRSIPISDNIEALNEVNYGSLCKKNKQWVEDNISQHKNDPDYIYPEGESFRQMQERSINFVTSLNGKYSDDTLLLVTHAGVIRGLISYFLDLPYQQSLKQKISHRYIGDFQFGNDDCIRYNELGKLSGFIRDRTVKIPWNRRG